MEVKAKKLGKKMWRYYESKGEETREVKGKETMEVKVKKLGK